LAAAVAADVIIAIAIATAIVVRVVRAVTALGPGRSTDDLAIW
jgi:hypothetical protein